MAVRVDCGQLAYRLISLSPGYLYFHHYSANQAIASGLHSDSALTFLVFFSELHNASNAIGAHRVVHAGSRRIFE